MQEESDPNLRVGGFFLEREHFDEYKTRASNANFPLIYDLRPNRFEENQLFLHRTRAGRIPDRPYRLGLSYLQRLRTRLSLHDFPRTVQRSIAQAQ